MLTLVPKTQFRKDVKKLPSSGLNPQKLVDVMRTLQEGKPLDAKHRVMPSPAPGKRFASVIYKATGF